MRRTPVATFAVAALALCSCGGGGSFANKPRPAVPVNLTVYINNRSVSVSPRAVGAGQVVFIVTNQANRAESLSVRRAGGSVQLASTGPINPQGTSQVAVNFPSQGVYTVVSSDARGATDAAQATPTTIRPALVRIGPARPSSSDQLLLP